MFKQQSQYMPSSKVIFDKFINFLTSSMWNIPIATFLEQYSAVFDDEQNDLLFYQKIHNEFKSIVDTLMQGFCGDLQIKAEQLFSALKHHDNSYKLSTKERSLLGPLVAAQNFDIFVPMMICESIGLRLQTIQMIEFLCDAIPTTLCIESNDISKEDFKKLLMKGLDREQYNRYVFTEVLRKSKAEFKNEAKKYETIKMNETVKANLQTKDQLEECKQKAEYEINMRYDLYYHLHSLTIKDFKIDGIFEHQKVAFKYARFMDHMALAQRINDQKEFSNTNASSEVVTQFNFEESKKLPKIQDSTQRRSSNKLVLQEQLRHITRNDIEERAAYFRKQRDKMLNMKHAIRDQQFQDMVKSMAKERPQTAKAARIAMSSKSNYGTTY